MRFDALIVSHIFGILPGGLMESQAGLYQERCTIIFLCNQEISISVHLIAYVFFFCCSGEEENICIQIIIK